VVDLFYTIPFLLSVIAVSFINRTNGWRKKINYLGLGLSSAYLIAGLINKYVASDVFRKDLASEKEKKELVFVGTTPLNIALWYGVAESDSAFHIGYYSLFDESKDVLWASFQKNHQLIASIENEYGVDRLMWFSDQLFVLTQPSADTINFYTLKFGRTGVTSPKPEDSFVFYFQIIRKADGSLAYESIRNTAGLDMKKQLGDLYDRAMGN
jgi:inner membrane protein